MLANALMGSDAPKTKKAAANSSVIVRRHTPNKELVAELPSEGGGRFVIRMTSQEQQHTIEVELDNQIVYTQVTGWDGEVHTVYVGGLDLGPHASGYWTSNSFLPAQRDEVLTAQTRCFKLRRRCYEDMAKALLHLHAQRPDLFNNAHGDMALFGMEIAEQSL